MDGDSRQDRVAPRDERPYVMIDLLVVDPSIPVRKTLERLLEAHGYAMRGVTRGTDALQQLARQRPDLILSEATLPDMSALELCQQVWLSGVPMLLMSEHVTDALRLEARDAGALEMLTKPLSQHDLLRTLARHLKLPAPLTPSLPPSAPTLLASLMTRPGLLGALIVDEAGLVLEQVGAAIPAALYQPVLTATCAGPAPETRTPASGTPLYEVQVQPSRTAPLGAGPATDTAPSPAAISTELQCAQLEYPAHSVLLSRLPGRPSTVLICLLQNGSYASLIKYYLRSSPFLRS